jgi:hypothetical protein
LGGPVQQLAGEGLPANTKHYPYPRRYVTCVSNCEARLSSIIAELQVKPEALANVPIVVDRYGRTLQTFRDSKKWLKNVDLNSEEDEDDGEHNMPAQEGCAVGEDGRLLDAEYIEFSYDPDEDEETAQQALSMPGPQSGDAVAPVYSYSFSSTACTFLNVNA